MILSEKELARLPEHLQRLFVKLPNAGSEEVLAGFPESAGQLGALKGGESSKSNIYGKFGPKFAHIPRGDSGSAARFFYTAKADSNDRLGSKHPTVKPLDLMQYLVRLVTPRGGTVLDCFAGTGTTGEAALREGMCAVLIERESEYQEDIRRRMKLAMAGPNERARESIKERMKGKPPDHGPLFA
jgi:site-specific DNA-methyltransferase (adenine-specific)